MDSKWTARETLCLLNYFEHISEQSTKKPSFVAFKDQIPSSISRSRPDGFFSHQACQKRAAQVVKENEGSVKLATEKFRKRAKMEFEREIQSKQARIELLEKLVAKVKSKPTEEDCQKLRCMLPSTTETPKPAAKELKIKTKKVNKPSKSINQSLTPSTPVCSPLDSNFNEKDVDPAWKKAAIMLWKQIADHKYASIFMNPVKDEHAKSYSTVIKEPMDLARVRKRIDQGIIRNSQSLQRDLLLIFQNAMMYNSSKTEIYRMAFEMEKDVNQQVADFIGTRMMVKIDA